MINPVTWEDLSRENLRAAKLLFGASLYRACVTRAYYTVYCALTSKIVARNLSLAHGWKNPAHDQVAEFVQNNLPLSDSTRRNIMRSLRTLRAAREDADYRPVTVITAEMALESLRDATAMLRDLEIEKQ